MQSKKGLANTWLGNAKSMEEFEKDKERNATTESTKVYRCYRKSDQAEKRTGRITITNEDNTNPSDTQGSGKDLKENLNKWSMIEESIYKQKS